MWKVLGLTSKNSEADSLLADAAFGGLLWQFSGTFGKGLLQIGFLTILARLVTPEEFGIVSAALIVVGLSQLFGQFGVGPALVYQSDLREEHVRVGFLVSCALSAVVAGSVWLLAPWIAGFFRMPELEAVLVVLSLVFVIRGAGIVAESLLQRDLAFRQLAYVDVVSYGVGYGIVGTTLGYYGYGYWALVAGHIGQSLLQTAAYVCIKRHPMRPVIDISAGRELFHYGGGYTLLRFANYGAAQGDNVVIGRVLGAEALGIYGRAYQLLVTPARLFGFVLDRVLFPTMARIQEDPERLVRSYRRAVATVALFALPTSGVVFVLAPEIVNSLLGGEWVAVTTPLQIFAIAILFRTSYKISDSLVRATGEVYRGAWRHGLYAIFVVVGAGLGSVWGIEGVAVGIVTAIMVQYVMMAQLCLDVTGLGIAQFLGAHLPALRLSVAITVASYAVATVLRSLGIPSPVLLVGTGLILLVTVRSGLVTMWPVFFLGREGMWAVEQASERLPAGLVRVIVPARIRQVDG